MENNCTKSQLWLAAHPKWKHLYSECDLLPGGQPRSAAKMLVAGGTTLHQAPVASGREAQATGNRRSVSEEVVDLSWLTLGEDEAQGAENFSCHFRVWHWQFAPSRLLFQDCLFHTKSVNEHG